MCNWMRKLELMEPAKDFAVGLVMVVIVLSALALATIATASEPTREEVFTAGFVFAAEDLTTYNDSELDYTMGVMWPVCKTLAQQLDDETAEWTNENTFKLGMCAALVATMNKRKQLRTI